MTRRRPARGRALVALLLLACILAGGALALHRADPDLLVLRLGGGQDAAPPAHPPDNTAGPGQPATRPQPESRFAVIALRPLFSAGRRPSDQPESVAAAISGGALSNLLVTGIVIAGADSVAILEPTRPGPQAEPALIAHVGDGVAGWTVEAIEPGRVVLVRDGERHEMPLIDEADPRRASAVRRRPAPPKRRQAPAAGQPQPPQQQPQQLPLQPSKSTP